MASLSPRKRLHESMGIAADGRLGDDDLIKEFSTQTDENARTPTRRLKYGEHRKTDLRSPPPLSNLSTPNNSSTILTPTTNFNSTPIKMESDKRDDSTAPPAKRRKLTAAEKAEKQTEAKLKAEEKSRKEQERKEKEALKKAQQVEREETRKEKEKEKEEKRKLKEAKEAEKEENRKKKEAEQKAKDEEKAKKERSQMKLNTFFTKTAGGPSDHSAASSRRGSVSSEKQTPLNGSAASDGPGLAVGYEKTFLPFFVKDDTVMATLVKEQSNADEAWVEINWGIEHGANMDDRVQKLRNFFKSNRMQNRVPEKQLPVKDIMIQIQQTQSDRIDFTSPSNDRSQLLHNIPIKYLQYQEDIRPPWIGTYTKFPAGRSLNRLCRNPFRHDVPEVGYDYDSEAEWEAPDPNDDHADDESDDDDDREVDGEMGGDMDGFLDDENDEPRKQLKGDMEPVCTGIHWASNDMTSQSLKVAYGKTELDLASFRLQTLLPMEPTFPIDPFSVSYWASSSSDSSPMKPPSTTILKGQTQLIPTAKPLPIDASSKGAKSFPAALLPAFKKSIQGSVLTKLGLIEVLKKEFPSVTKKMVEQTLMQVAHRDGKKESEKVWRVRWPGV